MDEESRPLITSIRVERLFGRYSYVLQAPDVEGIHGRLMLLHGPNGAGKTTILRLLWDLLSPADNRGHRSAIARVPFARFEVQMSGGARLAATRSGNELTGGYTVTLERPGKPTANVEYVMRPDRDAVTVAARVAPKARGPKQIAVEIQGETYVLDSRAATKGLNDEQQYLEFLRTVAPKPLLLADDRMLSSDDYEASPVRESLAHYEEYLLRGGKALKAGNTAELEMALDRANEHLRELTLGGQDVGSASSHEIYATILRQFADSGNPLEHSSDATRRLRANVARLLADVQKTAPGYEAYGLVPPIDAAGMSELIGRIEGSESESIALGIIEPFLSSLVARYQALRVAEETLRSLVPTLNSFLRDKTVTFRPREGLRFVADGGELLEPGSLSSGERQLVMLLSTTLLAARESSIFIVDEPELSLGVTWQRMILDALLRVTSGSSLQFIVATHSIEILAGHAESIVAIGEDDER